MKSSEPLCLLPERAHQGHAAFHLAQIPSGALGDVTEIAITVVQHRMVIRMTPGLFNGLEFGHVRRKVLPRDHTKLCLNELAYPFGVVSLQPNPDAAEPFAMVPRTGHQSATQRERHAVFL